MTKICFVSPEYLPLSGGTGAYVYYLSKELMRNGYDVCIVTGYMQTGDVKVNKQCSVYFLRVPKTAVVKSFMFAASSMRKLRSARDVAGVDVAHVNLPLVPNFAVPTDFGRALVSTVHSTWRGEADAIRAEPYTRLNANEKFMVSFNWFLRLFEAKMMQRSRKLIAVSEFTRRELVKYYGVKESKIKVIHNGVDTDKFKPPPFDKRKVKAALGFNPDDTVVLSVGRLYARKGLFTLIESIPAVVRKFCNVKFIISGKGQSGEMNKLLAHAQKLGVKEHVVFTGYYPDQQLPRLYQAADIFAFSTFYEHHPFAVLEALATGLPVVTNRVGGIPETITNGKTGFLCEPFNAQQFSERILYFLEHPADAQEMGHLARKTIEEQFDWRVLVKKTMAVYKEVLS